MTHPRGATETAPAAEETPPEPVLELCDLRKAFGAVVAVDRLDLAVAEGEIVTLVGPSGCGKSTVLRLVAGLLPLDGGEIRLRGETVAGAGAWRPPERRSVGIVFQDYALFPHLDVADNVAFGLAGRPRRQRDERVREVLVMVDLADHARRYPHELSGGEQQRVALARALAPAPAVLLLDEPFSNLDQNLRARVRADTATLLRAAGATAVFVTHDQQEALAVGDRVVVMRTGRVEQDGNPAEVFHRPASRFVAAFMGEADFLPARRRGGRLVTELGAVAAGIDAAAAEVVVRPHDVVLRPDPDGRGEVIGREFRGAFVLYTVRLPSGQVVRALRPHTEDHALGARVAAGFAPDHLPAVLPAP